MFLYVRVGFGLFASVSAKGLTSFQLLTKPLSASVLRN
jgi:hypothetical protein